MTATQIQNLLVLCLIVGYASMEFISRRYKTTVNATGNDTKLELFMFLSLLAITQPLAILATAKLGAWLAPDYQGALAHLPAWAMVGILLPSTTLTFAAARWGHRNRELRAVRAFKQGMAPIVIALLVATGWILATGSRYQLTDWPVWLLAATTAGVVWRTRIHLLWLLGAGAALGALGWI